MSTDKWARAAVDLAYLVDAEIIVFEGNFGGDQAGLIIRTAWSAMCAERGITNRLCPRIVQVSARKNKRLRAEPIAQQIVEDRVRIVGKLAELVGQWCTWMPTDSFSPGRLDTSVYLTLALLGKEPTDIGTVTPAPDPVAPAAAPLPVMPGTPRTTGGAGQGLPVAPGFPRIGGPRRM